MEEWASVKAQFLGYLQANTAPRLKLLAAMTEEDLRRFYELLAPLPKGRQ